MKQGTKVLAAVALALCLFRPATASFLYDVTINSGAFNGANTHQQFIEPTILTSSTPVTNFLVNTSTGSEVTSLWLGPDEFDQCFYSGFVAIGGPCLVVDSSSAGHALFVGMPIFESVGTFTSGDINRSATIVISEIGAVPEPSSTLLLLTGLAALVLTGKHRRLTPGRARR